MWVSHPNVEPYGTYFRQNAECVYKCALNVQNACISFNKFTALQRMSALDFNATFPFSQVFSLSPFPLVREPTVTAWRGTTLGRDITNAISLIMPLRLRGSYATERHAFSHFTSSPTLDLLAAIAARVLSSKSHIPFICALRISFRFGRNPKSLSS